MIGRIISKIDRFTSTRNKVYYIGLLLAFLTTFIEASRRSYNNFQIFSHGSLDFWAGVNPYTSWNHISLLGKPLDFFLYSPQFSILFTPYALLPGWLGVFCWNLFTYTLFYFSVMTLPDHLSFDRKKFIFFFTLVLLLYSLLSVQFNPVVAALFLFSFTLLEKDKGFWAVFLILLSGFTKIYGIFQIGMLLFYPRFGRNLFYAFIIGITFLFLPAVKIPLNELFAYYETWIKVLMIHGDPVRYDIFYSVVYKFYKPVVSVMGLISVAIVCVLYSVAFLKNKLFKESFLHRARFLGLIMSWAILFGTSSEKNTYVIALAGYVLWYLCTETTRTDKILLWINFILLEIVPIDIFCPRPLAIFLLTKLNLGIIVFTITWCIMVYKTFSPLKLKGV